MLDHGPKPTTKLADFSKGLLQHGRERQETESVSSRCGIKYDNAILHRLDVPANKCELNVSPDAIADTHFIISANPMASSTPGIAKARSCIMDPIAPPPPCWSAERMQENLVEYLYLWRTTCTYIVRSFLELIP